MSKPLKLAGMGLVVGLVGLVGLVDVAKADDATRATPAEPKNDATPNDPSLQRGTTNESTPRPEDDPADDAKHEATGEWHIDAGSAPQDDASGTSDSAANGGGAAMPPEVDARDDAAAATEDAPIEAAPIEAAPIETAARPDDTAGELRLDQRARDEDPGDQGIGAAMGIAAGGRVTPGGLRITGHYLYQLSSEDWFDGTASFTFGGGESACFLDRMATTQCGHDFNDGNAIELAAGVRRLFAARGDFRPFARAAVGLSFVRFRNDEVTGVAIPLHLGGGVRARVAPGLAVVGQAEVMLGLGEFSRGLGSEPQLGMAVTAGAEFSLR